jgi:hypothetical protein
MMGDGNHPSKGHCLPLAHDSAFGRIPFKQPDIPYSKGHCLPLAHDSALGRIPFKQPDIPYSDWFTQSPVPIFPIPISVPLFTMLILLFCPEDGDSSFLQNVGNVLPVYMTSHLKGCNLRSHCYKFLIKEKCFYRDCNCSL